MLIIDGPDGSGKSTLIHNLGYERRHLRALRAGRGADGTKKQGWGGSDEAPIAYTRQLLKARVDEHFNPAGSDAYGTCIAFDRFHISEQVYGPMLRGQSGITQEEAWLLGRVMSSLGVYVIVCLPPFEVTLANVMKQGRERPVYQTESFLRAAHDKFTEIARTQADLVYDYTLHPIPVPCRPEIVLTRCPPGVIGSPFARYLIVEEKSTQPLGLPCMSMRGASGFLNQALWAAGFDERQLAFTVAHDASGPRALRQAYDARFLGADVIALGRKAADQCLACGLAAVEMPHPLYWTRFHAGELTTYVKMLRDIRLSGGQ